MGDVIDIKSAKEINVSNEMEQVALDFAKQLDSILYVIAEALDSVEATEIGSAVAMQIFIEKICEKNKKYNLEYVQRGASFFNKKK